MAVSKNTPIKYKRWKANISLANKGKSPWNKGLTKETNKSLQKMAEALKGVAPWNKGLTKETNDSMRIISDKMKGKSNHRFGIKHSVITKIKRSEALKGKTPWNKGLHPECLGKENHYSWQGGISFEPYGSYWKKYFKKKIAERDKWTCQYCGGEALDGCPHHINYNKKDSNEKHLVWVHMGCNSIFNNNRDFWFAFWCYHLGLEPQNMLIKHEREAIGL